MSNCVVEHRFVCSHVKIALSLIQIQTAVLKLFSEVPLTDEFQHLHDCLVDASRVLSSADLFLKLPDND